MCGTCVLVSREDWKASHGVLLQWDRGAYEVWRCSTACRDSPCARLVIALPWFPAPLHSGAPPLACPRLYFTVTLYLCSFWHKRYKGASVHMCLGLEMAALCPECSLLFPAWASCYHQVSAPWTAVKHYDLLFLGPMQQKQDVFSEVFSASLLSAELFDQHKLWQSGIINFPQPTTWNSWKDGLSLFLIALAGLNCPLHCSAAEQECCMPWATALLPWAWDLNSVSSVREKKEFSIHNYFFLKDELNCNALMVGVIIYNSGLVSTHCLKLILISTIFPSILTVTVESSAS